MRGRRSSPSELDVRVGSQAVIPNSVQNVRSWVKGGPQFKVTGSLLDANSGHFASMLFRLPGVWPIRLARHQKHAHGPLATIGEVPSSPSQ